MVESQTRRRRGPKPDPSTPAGLLRAGVDMIHARGFSATGVKDIVTSAHVPKGSFYNHFASKEIFGAEVVDAYFAESLESMRTILQDETVAPLERLHRYFENRTARLRDTGFVRGCLLGNLTLETADHSELIRERLAQHFETWAALLQDCIEQAQRHGTIGSTAPAPMLAQFLLSGWEGALLLARAEKSVAPLTTFTQLMFDTVLGSDARQPSGEKPHSHR